MIAGAQRPMLICIILHWLLWLPECAASHCDLFSNRRCTDFPDWVYSRSVTLPFVSPFWKRSGCKGCAKPTSCNQILVRKTLHRSPFASMLRMCPLKDFATRCNADSDSHSRIKPVPHESIQSWFAHVGPMIWRSFVSKITFDITDRNTMKHWTDDADESVSSMESGLESGYAQQKAWLQMAGFKKVTDVSLISLYCC